MTRAEPAPGDHDFAAIAVMAALVVAGAIASFAFADDAHARPRLAPPAHRVDLATADAAEIATLPRVGPALAARIVADRAARGPFRSVEDLARVAGIGESTLEALRSEAVATQP